jgi:hypothetical protein
MYPPSTPVIAYSVTARLKSNFWLCDANAVHLLHYSFTDTCSLCCSSTIALLCCSGMGLLGSFEETEQEMDIEVRT